MTFPSVADSKYSIENKKRKIVDFLAREMGGGSQMFVIHLIMAGIADRTLSNIHGFLHLISLKNFLCSASILRQQLDTAMRANAFNLVPEPNALANHILSGGKFSDRVCKDGKKLKDWYLRAKLSDEFPWIDEVYKQTSSAVHLSERHVFASLSSVSDSARTFELSVSGLYDRPEEEFSEIFAAFDESIEVTLQVSFARWQVKK